MNKRFAVPALVGMLSAGLLLSACGGSDGGAFGPERASISITSTPESLPPNLLGWGPQINGHYTATLQVSAENDRGPFSSFLNEDDELEQADFSCVLVNATVREAGLFYLDGTDEIEEDPETGESRIIGNRSIVLANNSGTASFHVHPWATSLDEVTVRCSVVDPASIQEGTPRERVFTEHTIEIGATGSGDPAEILMRPRDGMIYPPGFAMPSTDQVEVVLLDEARGIVNDPEEGTNNVLVEILESPESGEYLRGRNADGEMMQGQALLLPTENGTAQFSVIGGFETGFIVIGATADQDDNNVDNIISQPVFGATSIVVTTGMGPPLLIETERDLPTAERLQPYATLLKASGGVPPYTWEVIASRPPTGLSLTDLNLSPEGVISGTPTGFGPYSFVAQVRDSQTPIPNTAQAEFEIVVEGEPPVANLRINTTSLPTATSGESYAVALSASGGVPPYSWSLVPEFSGDWLQISESGVLWSENPLPGTYALGVTVEGSEGRQANRELTLVVEEGDTLSNLQIVTEDLPAAEAGVPYSALIETTGANTTLQHTWTLVFDDGQSDLALTGSGLSDAVLEWADPQAAGDTYEILVEVTDGIKTVQKWFDLEVVAP